MRDEVEYERSQEAQAIGEHVAACMRAILDENDATTLAGLQRDAYKHTDGGISVSFELDDGTYIWVGNEAAGDTSLVTRVRKVGFSAIVEGSDAEVALTWMDLTEMASPEGAVSEYDRLSDECDDEACRLWDEAHKDDEEGGDDD